MHSSGMRTARLLTVSQHALGRGVCVSQHALGRGIPACSVADTPTPDRQTETPENT